jgi:glycosyltransferase involved in cell wall biosynthesis
MAQQNLRIAVIEPVGGHGGMDYYDFGLCSGLAAVGADVVLHTCEETSSPAGANFSVRQTYRGVFGKAPAWRRGLRFLFGSVRAVLIALLEGRTIVHLHFFHVGMLELFNVVLARLAGRKVVITAHDVESFVSSLEVPIMARLAYRLAHVVVAHNQISKLELVARLRVPESKIAVIPHGNYLHVLRDMPPVEAAKAKLGIAPDAKVLLFFGQIKEVKGLDLLLDAMPFILQEHPRAILIIAGKPWKTDFAEYQARINQLGIQNACLLHIRFIQDDELPVYYGASDIVVLPYRRIYQSGVVLMAMSYGKPVLVSDIPGMTEVVKEGETGFTFHSGDAGDLARRANAILSDSALMKDVAKGGKRLMEEKYSWSVIGQQMANVYENL